MGSNLLNENKEKFVEALVEEYEELREDHYASLENRSYLSLDDAIKCRKVIDFVNDPPVCRPNQVGSTIIEMTLEEVVPFFDWNPFFQTWELRGRYPNRGYPKIFNDEKVGSEAKKLFDDATAMLKEIVAKKSLSLKGIVGLYPANSVNNEDVEIYTDESRSKVETTFCMLRQQAEKEDENGKYFSQADFIAPKESGIADYMGMFAVACLGCENEVNRHEAAQDDYSKIMVQALADRLVEAFAEAVHKDIRTTLWGYSPDEKLSNEDLLKVKYQGIRPAPGYPSQPDHTEKTTMWNLMKVEEQTSITLSESPSMMPASSVSALVFAHQDSQYFAVGQIGKDQVENYAKRKGFDMEKMERWLTPILNYERS